MDKFLQQQKTQLTGLTYPNEAGIQEIGTTKKLWNIVYAGKEKSYMVDVETGFNGENPRSATFDKDNVCKS